MSKKDRFSFYKEHPKTCAPDDYWRQVMRTVNGRPISDDQIDWIVNAVIAGLSLDRQDRLLDLCCGNGALSDRFFDRCAGGLGIDFSAALIEIAKANFESPPDRVYLLGDVEDFLNDFNDEKQFTKALCYGSFMFLDYEKARSVLELTSRRFPSIRTFYIGNLPDKDKLHDFYRKRDYRDGIEHEPDSPIGIWRTKDEFTVLASECGWHVEFRSMRPEFYAAQYRYDAVLTRPTAGMTNGT